MVGVESGFQVPECVRAYLGELGYLLPLDPMDGWVRCWDDWMAARGEFYDYADVDGLGRRYEVHRRSLHPAMRVCQEWGSLLLNDKTQVVCDDQACTDWLADFFARTGFMAAAQSCVVRAFGLGTGALGLWCDLGAQEVRVRCYDARMVVPLSWDEDGVYECAFVTRAFVKGKAVDQLQMHLRDAAGFYRIETVCFDENGVETACEGVLPCFTTALTFPTFAILKPAITNTRVDMSPFGQSVFADALDAVQAVDVTFDALVNEVDAGKMRIFLSDVMFDFENKNGGRARIPFGKHDCTVFRKVMSTSDTIAEFAPALRTDAQERALRVALQMLGDLTGFGISYFDFDNSGYVKTATEVSSDNSALMRNIRRHENLMATSLASIAHAVLGLARMMGTSLPEEGEIRVTFDDSIITDTTAEKSQDMAEVAAGLMQAWEYRCKWYGEDEATARRMAGSGGVCGADGGSDGSTPGGKHAAAPGGSAGVGKAAAGRGGRAASGEAAGRDGDGGRPGRGA